MKDTLLTRVLLTIAGFVIVVAGMREASAIIIPFLLASFIATICFPAMVAMQRRGVRPSVAVLTIVLGLCLSIYLLINFAGNSIALFIDRADIYEDSLRLRMDGWITWLSGHNINISRAMLEDTFNISTALDVAVTTLSSAQDLVTNTFLILLTVVFILFEAAGLPNKLRIALGEHHPALKGISTYSHSLNRYLGLKSLISLITGVLVYVVVRIVGVDFPELWAVLAFLLNFIPNIGSIIAAIPPMILAMVQFGTPHAIGCGLGYLIINVAMGNLVEPRVMGKGLGLSTLVVFLSLVFWGWVLGPVGMFLSVPLTMVVKIAMESNRDTAWIAVLLGSDPGEGSRLGELVGEGNEG